MAPKTEIKKYSVSLDAGNRTTLVSTNGSIRKYRSLVYRPGTTIRHIYRDRTSTVTIGKESFVIGEGANAYGGRAQPVHSLDRGDGGSKIDSALLFLLGMIPTEAGAPQDVAEITSLRLMHPNPCAENVAMIRSALAGEHRATVNGQEVVRIISEDAIAIYPEPVPSYYHCLKWDFFKPGDTVFLVDLGGLTAIIQGFNKYGPMPDEVGRIQLEMGGTKELAARIGAAIEVSGLLRPGQHASAEIIMNALEEGSRIQLDPNAPTPTHRYRYGEGANAFYFDHLVPAAKRAWCNEVIGLYAGAVTPFKNEWAATVFVGGGANYIEPAIKRMGAGYHVCPEPDESNILGLDILGNADELKNLKCEQPIAA